MPPFNERLRLFNPSDQGFKFKPARRHDWLEGEDRYRAEISQLNMLQNRLADYEREVGPITPETDLFSALGRDPSLTFRMANQPHDKPAWYGTVLGGAYDRFSEESDEGVNTALALEPNRDVRTLQDVGFDLTLLWPRGAGRPETEAHEAKHRTFSLMRNLLKADERPGEWFEVEDPPEGPLYVSEEDVVRLLGAPIERRGLKSSRGYPYDMLEQHPGVLRLLEGLKGGAKSLLHRIQDAPR